MQSLVASVIRGTAEWVVRQNDRRPYVQARINGMVVDLLFDTGASISCLKADVWNLIKENCDVSEYVERLPGVPAVGANGKSLNILKEVKLTLDLAGQRKSQWFYVVADLPVSGLIGVDIIQEFGITYDPTHSRLIGPNESLVRLAHSVKIDPNDVCLVEVEFHPTVNSVQSENNYVIEGLGEHSIPPTLVNTTTGRKVTIPYFNNTAEPIYLKGQTVVAHSSTADQIEPFDTVSDVVLAIAKANNSDQLKREEFVKRAVKTEHIANQKTIKDLIQLCLEFKNIFSTSEYDLGKCKDFEHSVHMKTDEPIFTQQFRIPESHRQKIVEHVTELLKLNVLQYSLSKYSSPIFCVAKKSGGLRVVTDFRRINEHSVPHYHCGMTVDDAIDAIGRLETKFMSSLDMRACFYQIPLSKASRQLTAFTVRGLGSFEYRTCPMGLLSAPAACYLMMSKVLKGITNCIVYLDDVLVVSATYEDHLKHLRQVFERFAEFNLKLNPEKCSFFAEKLDYLGYELTTQGLRPGADKIAVVRDFKPPTTVKEIQSFIGLCQYFRRSLKNFSLVSQHLTNLTSKKSGWKGGELPPQALEAFQWFKERLCSRPLVRYPDFGRPFVLSTDAATGDAARQVPGGLGAVLTQIDDQGKEYVVSYASRGLKSFEKNYSAYLLELSAACWGIEHFSVYLKGSRFTLRVDHRPLTTLSAVHKKTLNNLQLLMLTYDFVLEYRPGKDMTLPDFCSRHPHQEPEEDPTPAPRPVSAIEIPSPNYVDIFGYSTADLAKMQDADAELAALKVYLRTKKMPSETDNPALFLRLAKQSLLNEHQLLFVVEQHSDGTPTPKLYVPRAIQKEFLRLAHTGLNGHAGISSTHARLRESCYWPSMLNDVRTFILQCSTCQHARDTTKRTLAPLGELDAVDRPWVRVHMDLFGPLKSTGSNHFVLVLTDAFSKYVELVPIPNKESSTVAEAFWSRWICRFGVPIQIISDRGPEFSNAVINQLCTRLGVDKRLTTAYHARTNGICELKNKTLARFIRSTIEENHTLDWETLIPAVAFSYNTATNAAVKTTPFRILFGLSPRYPINDAASLEGNLLGESFGDELAQRIENVRRHAEKHNMTFRESYTMNFNRDKEPMQVRAGQKVLLHSPTMALRGVPERRANLKFLRPWVGPYVVKEVHGNQNISLWLPHRRRGQNVLRVHTDRCKLYHEEDKDSGGENAQSSPQSSSHIAKNPSHVAKSPTTAQHFPPQLADSADTDQQNGQSATWNVSKSAKTYRDESDDEENEAPSESGSVYSASHGEGSIHESDESDENTNTSDGENSARSSDTGSDSDDDSDNGGGGGPSPPVSLTKSIQKSAGKFAKKVQQAWPKRTPAKRAAREILTEMEEEPQPGPSTEKPGSPVYAPAKWAQQPFATRDRLTRSTIKAYSGAEKDQQFAPAEVQKQVHRQPRSDRGKARKKKPDEQPPPQ